MFATATDIHTVHECCSRDFFFRFVVSFAHVLSKAGFLFQHIINKHFAFFKTLKSEFRGVFSQTFEHQVAEFLVKVIIGAHKKYQPKLNALGKINLSSSVCKIVILKV